MSDEWWYRELFVQIVCFDIFPWFPEFSKYLFRCKTIYSNDLIGPITCEMNYMRREFVDGFTEIPIL